MPYEDFLLNICVSFKWNLGTCLNVISLLPYRLVLTNLSSRDYCDLFENSSALALKWIDKSYDLSSKYRSDKFLLIYFDLFSNLAKKLINYSAVNCHDENFLIKFKYLKKNQIKSEILW